MKKLKNDRLNINQRRGDAHDEMHKASSRRTFLKAAGLTGGVSFLMNGLPMQTMALPHLPDLFEAIGDEDRVLVLVRLSGGNDGLNTIVPLDQYNQYRGLRPNISWNPSQLLNLTDQVAIPNVMGSMEEMWKEGQVRILQNVGYADQNLSHFRSTDIWSSGSTSEDELDSGWLGRMMELDYPNYILDPPDVPPSIQFNGIANRTTYNSDLINLGVVFRSADELRRVVQLGKLFDVNNLPDCTYGDQLGFVRGLFNSAAHYAKLISEVYEEGTNSEEGYTGELGEQLASVARLIRGRLGTKIYMVTLGGFDTHASQDNQHPSLLKMLSDNMKVFFDDLREAGMAKNVLGMTFSEFGRRIEENASQGTDHGAASPVMMFGDALNGSGITGENADLSDLDRIGNLKYELDFKSIYSTILEDWFCVTPNRVDQIMGDSYHRVDDLGFECTTTSLFQNYNDSLSHELRHHPNGQLDLFYTLNQSSQVKIDVLSLGGKLVQSVYSGRQISGNHIQPIRSQQGVPTGPYIYRIVVNDQIFSRQFIWMQNR